MIAILIVLLCVNIPYLIYYELQIPFNTTRYCGPLEPITAVFMDFSYIVVSVILPFLVMFACSILMGRYLMHRKVKFIKSRTQTQSEIQLIRVMLCWAFMHLYFSSIFNQW